MFDNFSINKYDDDDDDDDDDDMFFQGFHSICKPDPRQLPCV